MGFFGENIAQRHSMSQEATSSRKCDQPACMYCTVHSRSKGTRDEEVFRREGTKLDCALEFVDDPLIRIPIT